MAGAIGHGISGVPCTILLGMFANNAVSFANTGGTQALLARLNPGLELCTSTILRAGIVCVGAKLSIADVALLGATGVATKLIIVIVVIIIMIMILIKIRSNNNNRHASAGRLQSLHTQEPYWYSMTEPYWSCC
jgi:uncharacterized membrane protein YadS